MVLSIVFVKKKWFTYTARGIVAEPPAPVRSTARVMERIARREWAAKLPAKRLAQIIAIKINMFRRKNYFISAKSWFIEAKNVMIKT
jgi:hypothetical protein